MTTTADQIMKRIRSHRRGAWACTPGDFVGMGSQAAIDQALSRLTKSGQLRRVSHGVYDWPRHSKTLNRAVPPQLDAVIKAIARRDLVRVALDPFVVAHGLGLTDAVPAKAAYVTDGVTRTLKIDGRTVRLQHAPRKVMEWAKRRNGHVILALDWIRKSAASDPRVLDTLRTRLSDDALGDLHKGRHDLPSWAIPLVDHLVAPIGLAA